MKSVNSQAGFLLIEVLIAILIFSIGLLGLVAAVTAASRNSTESEDRGRAALWANEIVAQMWTTNSVTLSPTTISNWQTALSLSTATNTSNTNTGLGPLPNGLGTVTADAANAKAVISVTWQEPKATATSTYTTTVYLH
ncbi:prepilin-type N-terminal cleavage/methylation domain-containing protein [Silvimonas sp.]|uniref:type IV pilus modification PilV family protein n=1 Tax=Silvimonas sp. TaxID=2650811 RepID=UPI00283DEF1B|nr:prepilin-type N-terminal cleavage/methylation domain-containing protein [Silvimonas sp.]MDR3429823.1 prepilin-type N-terminal cleavage/methylation domain-containing protein [Silvimonas sp.]